MVENRMELPDAVPSRELIRPSAPGRRRKLAASMMALVVIGMCSVSVGATAGPRSARPASACNWGASSVTASYENGQWVVSEPETSGCIPKP
jgi:hypothetical protein